MKNQSNEGSGRFFKPRQIALATMESVVSGIPLPKEVQLENQRLGMQQVAATVHPIRRWRSPQRPDAAVAKDTYVEAVEWFKELLGVEGLPNGFVIEEF